MIKRRNFIWYSFLFMAGCSAATGKSPVNLPEKLTFTVTDVQGIEKLQEEYGEFREELEQVLNLQIDFFPVDTFVAAAPAFLANQLDLALAGPSEYVILNSRAKAVPLVTVTRPHYRSVISVSTDSGLTSLEQLKGKKIAMRNYGSTASHISPIKMLMEVGLDPESDFTSVMLGDGGLEALLQGEVDAWVGSPSRRKRLIQAIGAKEGDFRIIAQGKTLPGDIFVANSNLDAEVLAYISSKILENQNQLLQAILASPVNKKYRTSEMSIAKDEDYQMIREVYQAIGQGDFLN